MTNKNKVVIVNLDTGKLSIQALSNQKAREMDLSQVFFRPPIAPAILSSRKTLFMSQFTYLLEEEQKELSRLYDVFESKYSKAICRKAKKGIEPEIYFGHIWRTALIPICIFGIQPGLRAIKKNLGHDLWEEVFTEAEAEKETKNILGEECVEGIRTLSMPGKFVDVVKTTQSMREKYYQAISGTDDVEVHVAFEADHLDCTHDMDGLSRESTERKIWEIECLCIPISQTKIAKVYPIAAEIIERSFLSALTRIKSKLR